MNRMDDHYLNATPVSVTAMKEIIKTFYKSAESRKRTIALVGESGIGKNTIISEACKELGVDELWFPAKGILPEDIRGIPMVENVGGEKTYVFKMMQYIAPAFDQSFKGIIHLDEFAQASKDVQAMLYMLLYDRRIDDKKLSDGAMVIVSMNPPQESEYMLSRIQKAAQERLLFFKLTSSVSEWAEWAKTNNLDFRIISFVTEHPQVMKENSGRRFHMLSDVMKAFGQDIPDHITLRAIAQSALDVDSASLFVDFMEQLNEVNVVKLIKGDKNEFEKLKNNGRNSRVYTRIQVSAVHALRSDNIEQVLGYNATTKDKVIGEAAKNIVKMLDIIKEDGLEIVVAFVKSLLKNNVDPAVLGKIDEEIEKSDDLARALHEALDATI